MHFCLEEIDCYNQGIIVGNFCTNLKIKDFFTYAGLKPGHRDMIYVRFVPAQVHRGQTHFRNSPFRSSVGQPRRTFLALNPLHQVIERVEALRLWQLQD